MSVLLSENIWLPAIGHLAGDIQIQHRYNLDIRRRRAADHPLPTCDLILSAYPSEFVLLW